LSAGIRVNVDAPLAGGVESSLVVEIAGWIAHIAGSPSRPPSSVVLSVGEFGWLEAPISLPRPDVVVGLRNSEGAQVSSDRCGFSLLVPVLLIRTGGPYILSIKHDNHQVPFAEVSFESISTERWQIATEVRPLTINSLGRSGSSLLCRMLAAHPQLHVPKSASQYGEIPICEYVCRLMAVLSSTGSYAQLNKVDEIPDFNFLEPPVFSSKMLRSNDREEFQHVEIVRSLTQHARRLASGVLSDYIAFARRSQPELRYVVEKSWNSYNLNLLGLLFEQPREIFLVREPSEFLRSQREFLRKSQQSEDLVRAHQSAAAHRLGNLARAWHDRKGVAYLLKYEDLIADPMKVFRELQLHLQLESNPSFLTAAAGMVGDESEHSVMLRTSSDKRARSDFEDYLKALTADDRASVDQFRREFGYA